MDNKILTRTCTNIEKLAKEEMMIEIKNILTK